MGKFITENNYMNRKIKYQGYVGLTVTLILTIIGIVNAIHPFGASIENVDGQTLTKILMDGAAGIAAVGTIIGLLVGYFVHPGDGDGTKEVSK